MVLPFFRFFKSCHFLQRIIFLFLLCLFSCVGTPDKADLSGIDPGEIKIHRYGRDLFAIPLKNIGAGLDSLSGEYSFFLGDDYRDTLNIIRIREYITDPFLKKLHESTMNAYPDLSFLEKDLTMAYRHILYYFPATRVPEFYTYISGIDVMQPVMYLDSLVVIGLDCYLGKDFEEYKRAGIPLYRSERMTSSYIVPDVVNQWAYKTFLDDHPGNRLIDQIIAEGKALYLLDIILPEAPDRIKIGYTPDQLEWCEDNEANLWAFLLENDLLFSGDLQKTSKLIQDGPFTSYFDRESPARTGIWIGWQIVRSYMKKNRVSPAELMQNRDAGEILSKSGYKP